MGPKKASWKPGTMMAPLPVVLVTSQKPGDKANIITIAWAGIVCTTPPMLSISVTRERLSHELISASGEFAVNIPTRKIARAVDLCGVTSGRTVDKFQEARLTAVPGEKIAAPIIGECPVSLECRLRKTLVLGSHTMFIAEIVNVRVDEDLLDNRGRLALEKAGLLSFAHGHYYEIGKQIGHFGFSVRKKGGLRKPSGPKPAGAKPSGSKASKPVKPSKPAKPFKPARPQADTPSTASKRSKPGDIKRDRSLRRGHRNAT